MIVEVIIFTMIGVDDTRNIVILRKEGMIEGIIMTVIDQDIEKEIQGWVMMEIFQIHVNSMCLLVVKSRQSAHPRFQEIKELHQKFCHPDPSI